MVTAAALRQSSEAKAREREAASSFPLYKV